MRDSKEDLASVIHESCSNLDSADHLRMLLVAFVLTFIPVISLKTFPFPDHSCTEESPYEEARYVLWKTVQCYFQSYRWSVCNPVMC